MKRVLLALIVLAGTVAAVVVPRLDTRDEEGTKAPAADERTELPGGGTSVLPENRVVAHYGAPQVDELGLLGIGTPREAAKSLKRRAADYERVDPSRPVLPVMELIAVVAQAGAGKDGRYRHRQGEEVIRRYLAAARRIDAVLLLDIQPGRATFPQELKAIEPFLKEPDVGVALDPEWRMGPKDIPGQVIGHVKAEEVNQVMGYVSRLVEENGLPDKLMVIHQFTPHMIRGKDEVAPVSGVDLVLNADGFGAPADKKLRYRQLAPEPGSPFFRGFKLFYEEDTGVMTPRQVLGLKPGPVDFVVYE